MHYTDGEYNALWFAFRNGNSAVIKGSNREGDSKRDLVRDWQQPSTYALLKRMAKKGLLNEKSLFSITPKGMQVLHDQCKRYPNRFPWLPYPEVIAEIEAALAVSVV